MKKILLYVGLICSLAFPSDVGYLNVITGRPNANIFIDGEPVGNDFVKKYELSPGEHYIRVETNGQLIYAKMVTIVANEMRTITTENFVDIRTNTASRGAINREGRRLGETKGQFGLGIQWGEHYPAKGMSLKWLPQQFIGLQLTMIGKTAQDDTSEVGIRGVFPLGTKIFSNTAMVGYSTVGFNFRSDDTLLGGSVGVEFGFADPLYFSIEVGVANGLSSNQGLLFSWSSGLHFYF
jgi:hypothetical protein